MNPYSSIDASRLPCAHCMFVRRLCLHHLRSRLTLALLLCLLYALLATGCLGRQPAAPALEAAVVAAAAVESSAGQAEAVAAVQVLEAATATPAQVELTATPTPTPTPPEPTPVPTVTPDLSLPPLSRTTNILLLGSDRRPNMPNWRTDVMMIIALDFEHSQAGVISIPRDIYIDKIPDHRPNRVNVIDYLGEKDQPGGGGPRLLAEILEERMQVPIHHYLRFDFEGFKDVVDALEGVTIEVDCSVSDYLPEEDIRLRLAPGTHRLDGAQALAYVRTRRQGGDLERVRRQQRFAWAVRDQVMNENLLSRIPALYVALKDAVATDINLIDSVRFVRFALALNQESVHGFTIGPPDLLKSGWRGGMSVFVAEWEQIAEAVQNLFDRPPLLTTNTVGPAGDLQRCN